MDYSLIARISPLYDFWNSNQDEASEKLRLLKVSASSPAAKLFAEEPYKWENLYQSISREIVNGDLDSIKGLQVLLKTINSSEEQKLLKSFSDQKIFSDDVLKKIINCENYKSEKKINLFRFLRILLSIFTNPYCLDIKRSRNHIYEHTGYFVNSFRKLWK